MQFRWSLLVQLEKLLDLGRWFTPFPWLRVDNSLPEPPGLPTLVAVVVFILWLGASIAVYAFRRRLFAGNGARIGMATRFGPYAITIGAVGVFLLGMRYADIPYVSIRFLLYATILAAIGYVVFLAYYLWRRYPVRLAEVRAQELRRRYTSERRKKKRSR
jgi:amino acid permease